MEEKIKYLELVEGSFTLEHFDKLDIENWPYTAYSIKDSQIIYTIVPKPVADGPWVTFTAEEANSSIGLTKLSTNQTLEYSTDTTTWNTFDIDTNISLNNGDKVYVRGVLSSDNTYNDYTQFKMTGKIAASGNCNALWDYDYLDKPLKEYCGYKMFLNCTGLTQAPELPATTLAYGCYQIMFLGCTGLTKAPELPATTLAKACYSAMFYGCISLTTAPELPATTLAGYCYDNMFRRCASLTTAPELPATTLAEYCYHCMLYNCSSINYIKCLATDISASNCTDAWVSKVADSGTFIKHPNMKSWLTGRHGIPEGWTVENAVL